MWLSSGKSRDGLFYFKATSGENLGAAFFIFGGSVDIKEIDLKPSFKDSYSVREAQVLNEKERRVKVTIIRVGPGNSASKNFYTQEAINSGVEIFEGATLGFNHPSKIDAQVHPEGDIEDIGGWIENVAVEGEKMVGEAVVLPDPAYDWFWTLIKASITYAQSNPGRNLMGLSINAKCAAEGTVPVDGEEWNKITKFVGVRRVDAVTTPAAGGMFEKIVSESRKHIEIFKTRLTGFEKIVGAMESKGDEPLSETKLTPQAAPTDAPTIYKALMQKVRNLEDSGAPGVDEVRRQLDELGTALKFNKTMEEKDMDYPGQDPTNPNPAAGGAGAGDMGEEALSPKDHAMAATFHKNMAAQCQSEADGGKGNPGMLAHHTKMAAFHAAKASEGDVNIVAKPKPENPDPNAAAPTEAESKAKEEAEAKAKKEAESKGKESDPNFWGPAGLKLLKESEMTAAGLTDKQKAVVRFSLESVSDPTKIKAIVTAQAAIWATEAGGGHNFQRREGNAGGKKSNLVGALRDNGVLGEE